MRTLSITNGSTIGLDIWNQSRFFDPLKTKFTNQDSLWWRTFYLAFCRCFYYCIGLWIGFPREMGRKSQDRFISPSVIYPLKYRGPTYHDDYRNMEDKFRGLNNTSSDEINSKTDQIKDLGQGFTMNDRISDCAGCQNKMAPPKLQRWALFWPEQVIWIWPKAISWAWNSQQGWDHTVVEITCLKLINEKNLEISSVCAWGTSTG